MSSLQLWILLFFHTYIYFQFFSLVLSIATSGLIVFFVVQKHLGLKKKYLSILAFVACMRCYLKIFFCSDLELFQKEIEYSIFWIAKFRSFVHGCSFPSAVYWRGFLFFNVCFLQLCQEPSGHRYEHTSLNSILLHWSVCQFSCQYHGIWSL